MENSRTFRPLLWFTAGILVTFAFLAAKTVVKFFFVGDEIVCQASFPRYHTACIYSRFGFGDQTITLQIDGEMVFSSGDLPGGNLNERVAWDSQGRKVTFHVDGLGDQVYDAVSKNRMSN